MKTYRPSAAGRITALCLLLALPAFAISGPELTVQGARGEKAQLSIESIETDIFFYQDLAETIITVNFKNPGRRMTEGEFAIPLPAGATVSSYALDVNGEMREGVVVEKERARYAYESIKRQMIDPGFVEREAGNVYRTKIFPIPARGTKAVRIGYCEILPTRNNKCHYRLPLPNSVPVENFRAVILHGENKTFGISALGDFPYPKTSVIDADISVKNVTLGKELALHFDAPKSKDLVAADGYSYLRHPLTQELQRATSRKLKTLEIYWDCSESVRLRDHKRELALLEKLFNKFPNLDVELSFFHHRKEPGGSFKIESGNWDKLRAALSNLLYDGATNFSVISPKADLTLVFSDGINSTLSSLPLPGKACSLVNSTGKPSAEWLAFVSQSDGQIIDLKNNKIEIAAQQISQHQLTFLSDSSPLVDRSFVRLFEKSNQTTGLKYRRSADTTGTIPMTAVNIEKPRAASIIRKLWAQQELLELEARAIPDRSQIIAHSKEHGLVSDETSLIVLDRFEDYVRYRIPPPEEDLRERYHKEITKLETNSFSRFTSRWNRRLSWHATHFPWQDHVLRDPISRISIWQKSLRQVFELKDLDQESVGSLARWKNRAIEHRKARADIADGASYQKWLAELSELQKQLKENQQLTPKPPKESSKIAVSLRGFVNKPGTYQIDSNLTLRKALKEAGGIDSLGTASGVAIYRNATKITYNTLSKQYRDIPLLPGDMVVVLQDGWNSPYASDGFADPFSTEPDSSSPADLPAIIEDDATITPQFLGHRDGPSDPFGGPALDGKTKSTLTLAKTEQSVPADLVAFDKALSKGNPALAAYSKLRKPGRHDDRFYIKAASILKKRGHPNLAHRVLSNLIEESTPRAASFRKWAFSLVQMQEEKLALEVLEKFSALSPNDPLILFDQAWLTRKISPAKPISSDQTKIIADKDLSLGEISAAYLYGKTSDQSNLSKLINRKALPVDLRIVVTNTSGLDLSYEILDPAGSKSRTWGWSSRISNIGGRLVASRGVAEFMMKDAIPGDYQLSFRSEESEILRLEIYRNWGKPDQHYQEHLISFSGSASRQEVFTYSLKFVE